MERVGLPERLVSALPGEALFPFLKHKTFKLFFEEFFLRNKDLKCLHLPRLTRVPVSHRCRSRRQSRWPLRVRSLGRLLGVPEHVWPLVAGGTEILAH